MAERVRQTLGLGAPEAPPGGALAPNETGWLIGLGSANERLRPRLWRWTHNLYGAAGMMPFWVGSLLDVRLGLPLTMLLGATSGLALHGLARALTARRLRQHLAGAGGLEAATPGRLVRLRGVIAPQPTVPTLFRGTPAVLFRSRIGAADETRGLDFVLEVAGHRVRVGARRAMLLDEPRRTRQPPACGPVYCDPFAEGGRGPRICSTLFTTPPAWLGLLSSSRRYEASVGPGDEVEVVGVLHHEVDPDGGELFGRDVPIARVLRAGGQTPLLVRSVAHR
jgi:hypothetical protein